MHKNLVLIVAIVAALSGYVVYWLDENKENVITEISIIPNEHTLITDNSFQLDVNAPTPNLRPRNEIS